MKKILNKINWAFARKRLDGMRPEDLVGQLGKDWKAYLKWSGRRVRMSSLLGEIELVANIVINSSFRRMVMVFSASSLIIVACERLAEVSFPGMISVMKTAAFGLIILFLSLTALYVTFKSIAIIMVLIACPLDKRMKTSGDGSFTDLKRFLKHRHGPLKNMYRSMVKNHVIERYCNEMWGESDELLDNNEDSSYYGIVRILSTVFISQPDSDNYDFYLLYSKTLEMIEFMLVAHRSLLKSNIDKIGLLVQQWPDLFTRRISWDDYNNKLDSMLSEARRNSSRIEGKDRSIVLDRLESLKRDSAVVNGSKDVMKMRDLVGMVHDSSTELIGKAVDR